MSSADELDAAYRLECLAVREIEGKAIHDAAAAVAAARQGRALARRHGAAAIQDAVLQAADSAVDRLIDAHLRAGERDADAVADRIRDEFVGQVLATPPGLAILQGHGSEAVALMRTAQDLSAKFASRRDQLVRFLKDRFLVVRSKLDAASGNETGTRTSPSGPSAYALLEPIGSGGFADVYAARHRDTDRVVALKVMTDDDEARRRAQREVVALEHLRHENIIEVLEAARDYSWYAMPRAEASLGKIADAARPGGADLRALVQDVAAGLEFAHDAGAFHRDLSPENILRLDRRWVIADWGMVKLPPELARSKMTRSGLGTLPWASPEVISDATTADGRADIFSLGRIVGWLVSGIVPDVNQPSSIAPNSEWFEFIRRATLRDREVRPATIADLLTLMPDAPESAAPRELPDAVPEPDLPCEVLWTVHIDKGSVSGFYVNYVAKGPDIVSKALTEPIPEARREELPESVGRAADQLAEYVLVVMPAPAEHIDGNEYLVPERTMEHVSHTVTPTFGGSDRHPELLVWSRERHFPGGGYEAPSGRVPLSSMNSALRECVAVLDEEAKRRANACIERLRKDRLRG